MLALVGWFKRNGPETRRRILELLERRPGMNKTEVCQHLGLAWGTVGYHLRILEREHLIHLAGRGRDVLAFPFRMAPDHRLWLCALHDGDAMRVLGALMSQPLQGVSGLSLSLGMSEKVIRRHVHQLSQDGILERQGSHRPRYAPNPQIEAFLQRYGLR